MILVRTFLLTGTLVLFSSIQIGCGGPTRSGIDARADARQRVDSFKASYTYQQANQHFETGDLDRGLREIDLAIQQAPGVAMFHLLRGRILLELHRLEPAADALETAVTLDDSDAEAHYFRGITMQRWSRDAEALENYRRAMELDASNVQYLLAVAEMLTTLGRTSEAVTKVRGKLAFFEHDPVLLQFLGHAAMLQGEPKRAAELILQARLADPTNLALMEEHLWAQYEAGDFGGALATAEIIRSRTGTLRKDLVVYEARSMVEAGQKAEAHRRYREIARDNPANVHAWIELGALAWELGDNIRVQEAAGRIVTLAPERYEGWMLQGIAERRRGRLDDAVRSFTRSVDRTKDETVPLLLLARTLESLGRLSEAIDAYEEAIRRDPTASEARWLLSMAQDALHATVDSQR